MLILQLPYTATGYLSRHPDSSHPALLLLYEVARRDTSKLPATYFGLSCSLTAFFCQVRQVLRLGRPTKIRTRLWRAMCLCFRGRCNDTQAALRQSNPSSQQLVQGSACLCSENPQALYDRGDSKSHLRVLRGTQWPAPRKPIKNQEIDAHVETCYIPLLIRGKLGFSTLTRGSCDKPFVSRGRQDIS
jgi:hypothetical protein